MKGTKLFITFFTILAAAAAIGIINGATHQLATFAISIGAIIALKLDINKMTIKR